MVIMSFAASLLDAQYTVYMLAFIYPVHNILIMFISHHMVRRRLGYYGQRGIVSAYARTTLASLFAGGIAAIALWLLGGYQLDGFAWASKLTATSPSPYAAPSWDWHTSPVYKSSASRKPTHYWRPLTLQT